MEIQVRRVSNRKLREARERARIRPGMLAEQIGVKESAVSYYESGHKSPSASTLASIARALHVTMDDLMEDVE